MPFHITITNNETGETLHDRDVYAIIGAFKEENRTGCVALTECNAFEIAATIDGALDAIQHIYDGTPYIKPLVETIQTMPQKNEEDK
jgi:hypothetical protein